MADPVSYYGVTPDASKVDVGVSREASTANASVADNILAGAAGRGAKLGLSKGASILSDL